MEISRRKLLRSGGIASGALGLGTISGCSPNTTSFNSGRKYAFEDLDISTPAKRNQIITKIMGSIGTEETHGFMRFHIYGFTGDGNVIPFFSMNNYIVQRWKPADDDSFELAHYEVGYYTEFDTDNPIETWNNPVTNETLTIDPFILGPITRLYTPDGIESPGIAPQPLRLSAIGNRAFIPGQSIESFPNLFQPDEWPEISSGPKIFWDSMYTFSAYIEDIINPEISSAPAEIHMQNLVSWQPFLGLGPRPGRTMSRAFGSNISGFEALSPDIRKAFEHYTPEIFKTDSWTEVRFDSFDYYNKKVAERDALEKKQ